MVKLQKVDIHFGSLYANISVINVIAKLLYFDRMERGTSATINAINED